MKETETEPGKALIGRVVNRRSGKNVEYKLKYGLNCYLNKESRLRSLYLSGECVRICGLLKFALWWVLDWIWSHTSEVSLV